MSTLEPFFPPLYLGGPEVTGENCEREPIHIPGSIQPHGALLGVDARSGQVVQASQNAGAWFGLTTAEVLGSGAEQLLGTSAFEALRDALPEGSPDALQYRASWAAQAPSAEPSSAPPSSTPPSEALALTAHRTGELLILEFERGGAWTPTGPHALRNAIFELEHAESLDDLAVRAARVVREISGFDRALVYRFGPDASGEVIAEAQRGGLSSFLRHRFPASDIPAQARALYVRHLLRLTADTLAEPVPLEPRLNPQSGAPTPLGGAVLRSTSPMHLQYLRNMGVRSSLSVSIVSGGQLWGLIACHHQTPYVVPPETRTALEYLGRLLSLQVQLKQQADTAAFRRELQARRAKLVEEAARSVAPHDTFANPQLDLLGLMRAGGAVMLFEGRWQTRGVTPDTAGIDALLAWLRTQEDALIHTDALGELWPPGQAYAAAASGLLAISIGPQWREALVWLRPELHRQVAWGGAGPAEAKTALGPRQSFETYLETVRGHAEPWHEGELEEARELQRTLTGALGARLSVVRDLNAALAQANAEWRQYAFVIAHHMREPVRLITQFTELFRLRFRDQIDAGAERMIEFMLSETARLRSLTSDLQTYTGLLSSPAPTVRPTPLGRVVSDVLSDLSPLSERTGAQLEVSPDLPEVSADPALLREALTHLLRNALTFGGEAPPRVAVRAQRASGLAGRGWMIEVRDEGVGIAPEYHDKVFGLFQRLGALEEAQGNGIGLALARKIAELHGGSLTVSSEVGRGSTFSLFLPDRAPASAAPSVPLAAPVTFPAPGDPRA